MATSDTWGSIIGNFENIFLIDVPLQDYEMVFISTTYAVCCTNIISGAVLERMKNSAFIVYCFLTIIVNYSVASCWSWNQDAWLYKLGYFDCAGGIVVHGTAGVSSALAMYLLGPRIGSLQRDNISLRPVDEADRPIWVLLGTLVLWYGWFGMLNVYIISFCFKRRCLWLAKYKQHLM